MSQRNFLGKNMLLRDKKVAFLLLIALTLRLAMFLGTRPWNRKDYEKKIINQDAIMYNEFALALVKNHKYTRKDDKPSAEVPPGYPLFIATIYFLFGYRPYVVVLSQILLGGITCLLLYKLGTAMFDEKVGLVAGYLLAFEHVSIMFEQVLYSDTLFTFLFLIAIYLFANFLKTNYKKHLVYVGIFLGLAALCRPIGLYFPLVLILLFIFWYIRRKITFTMALTSGLIITLLFWATISPWLIRNYLVFNPPLGFTSRKATVLMWYVAYIEQVKTGVSFNTAMRMVGTEFNTMIKDKQLSPFQLDDYKKQFALKKILENPLTFAKAQSIGAIALYLGHGKNIFSYLLGLKDGGWLQSERHQLHSISAFFRQEVWPSFQGIINTPTLWLKIFFIFMLTLFVMFYVSVIIGSVIMWQDKKFSELLLLISIIGYFTILSVPSGNMRFRIPFMPYMMILAAYAIVKLWNKYRESAAPQKLLAVDNN
jgi:4-amino-4-deoxy-L-arabinose transferase-like glycosyltransferase